MICNEGELLERFGIQVYPVTLIDVQQEVDEIKNHLESADFAKTIRSLEHKMDCSRGGIEAVRNLAALKTAINRLVVRYRCTAVAIQCWFSMQKMLGIMPCVANGLLTEEGIPTTCETNIHGAVSSILLQEAAMRTTPVFFADMTVRHPENENAELLWHCGNYPPSLAKDPASNYLDNSFILDSHCPGIHGKFAHILLEACKYIPGLTPDAVEPTEPELRARIRDNT